MGLPSVAPTFEKAMETILIFIFFMTYKVLIADDESVSRRVVRNLLEREKGVEIVAEAATGTEALGKILHYKPDIIYLDIRLPEADGFEVLKEISAFHQPAVVFTTIYTQYAIQAFEVAAADYLVKPFSELRFKMSFERAKQTLSFGRSKEADNPVARRPGELKYLKRILVKEKQKQLFINLENVLYIQAEGNYIALHTESKKFIICEKLFQLEDRLNPADFVRVSRSHLVNLAHVREIESYFNGEFFVFLNNGTRLKWTRFYKDNLKFFYTREV